MLAKSIVALAAFAALAEQSLASNFNHRHLHRRFELQKRQEQVDWVTIWTTVYVNAPQQTEAPPHRFLADQRPAKESAVPSASPPLTPVYDDAAEAQESEAQELEAPAPQTTLATSVKPLIQVEALSASIGYGDKPLGPSAAPATPAASGAPQDGAVFPGKRGVAYNDAKLANSLASECKKCGWAYNWGSSSEGLDPKLNFVPTLWGTGSQFTSVWQSNAQKAIENGAKAMLSFNEPDHQGQANLSPQAAAAAHAQYMNPFAGKVLIGSPSVTNSGSPGQGIQWLKSFMSECEKQQDKCRVDFCAVHWYSQEQYTDTLFKHLEDAHEACGRKPIWLTEYAPVNDAGQPVESTSFLKTVMPKLEAMPFLTAHAPFMCADGKLMSANQLSDTGKIFIS